MPMILRDFAVHGTGKHQSELETQVLFENNSLSELFVSLLPKLYITPNTAKIVPCFCPSAFQELDKYGIKKNTALVLLEIVEYWHEFDFVHYSSLTRIEQRKYFWKEMCYCTMEIAKQLNWDPEPLKPIYEAGLSRMKFY